LDVSHTPADDSGTGAIRRTAKLTVAIASTGKSCTRKSISSGAALLCDSNTRFMAMIARASANQTKNTLDGIRDDATLFAGLIGFDSVASMTAIPLPARYV
jgi:hypothetical protein